MAAVDENWSSQISQTAVKKGLNIPVGHILVSNGWRGSSLVTTLREKLNILHDDNLGVVDFYPSAQSAVLYITAQQLTDIDACKRNIRKLREVQHVRGTVLLESTEATETHRDDLQAFTVKDLGMVLVPVPDDQTAANYLIQLVDVENNPGSNLFRKRRHGPCLDESIKTTLKAIPKLGDVKAQQLLARFESLSEIANATIAELSSVVGQSQAQTVYNFFNSQHSR